MSAIGFGFRHPALPLRGTECRVMPCRAIRWLAGACGGLLVASTGDFGAAGFRGLGRASPDNYAVFGLGGKLEVHPETVHLHSTGQSTTTSPDTHDTTDTS